MDRNEKNALIRSIGKLDIEQARIKHVLFKSKLRALLYGAEIDTEPVLSTTACSLGKWIYEVAMPNVGHLTQVRELERVHNDMHAIARRLWELYKSGQQEQAQRDMTQIDETAEKLLQLLSAMERQVS